MENKEKKLHELAQEILNMTRGQLLVNFRFLDMALFQLKDAPNPLLPWATDGVSLLYNDMYILEKFQLGKSEVMRSLMHVLLHCVFQHMYVPPTMDMKLWDISCDIAVEAQVLSMDHIALYCEGDGDRRRYLKRLKDKLPQLTAERIYSYFRHNPPTERDLEAFTDLYRRDIHAPWYIYAQPDESSNGDGDGNDRQSNSDASNSDGSNDRQSNSDASNFDGSNDRQSNSDASNSDGNGDSNSSSDVATRQQAQRDWEKISRRMQVDLEAFSSKQQGTDPGDMIQALKELHREKYDYRSFLKKFATRHEVMKLSEDEFDYVFYTYGLQLYRDMPIIEPLEYRDAKRIKELVIAIDTSGSTSGPLVQTFLQKTYNILKEEETFLRRFNLHIIQCDAEIQEDAVITNQNEFDEYIKNLTIKGLGGTDFRPVFQRVNRLIAEHAFRNLKGLIYFTDGYGTFPEQKPMYDTAFVFVEDEANDVDVPPWAIKLILRTDEIMDN